MSLTNCVLHGEEIENDAIVKEQRRIHMEENKRCPSEKGTKQGDPIKAWEDERKPTKRRTVNILQMLRTLVPIYENGKSIFSALVRYIIKKRHTSIIPLCDTF